MSALRRKRAIVRVWIGNIRTVARVRRPRPVPGGSRAALPLARERRVAPARGFSLLEVLAALALLALLLLGVYSGIRTAAHSVRSGSAAVERLDQVRSAQQFLRRELEQAMTQQLAKNDIDEPIFFKGDARSMSFVAPLPGYLGKLGPQAQTLRLADDGKGGQRLEISFALLAPDGKPLPAGPPQVLLDHVSEGRFSYRGRDARGRATEWRGDWPTGDRLPRLVRIDLRLPANGYWPQLTIPLRVDASANQRQFSMIGDAGPAGAWGQP